MIVLVKPALRIEFGCVRAPDVRVAVYDLGADKDVHGSGEEVRSALGAGELLRAVDTADCMGDRREEA